MFASMRGGGGDLCGDGGFSLDINGSSRLRPEHRRILSPRSLGTIMGHFFGNERRK
jgi:hypothetical protein